MWVADHSWRTNFPPPPDFFGDEEGLYGDGDYTRQCTPEERAAYFAAVAAELEQAEEVVAGEAAEADLHREGEANGEPGTAAESVPSPDSS